MNTGDSLAKALFLMVQGGPRPDAAVMQDKKVVGIIRLSDTCSRRSPTSCSASEVILRAPAELGKPDLRGSDRFPCGKEYRLCDIR